jgi:hypothetical protein
LLSVFRRTGSRQSGQNFVNSVKNGAQQSSYPSVELTRTVNAALSVARSVTKGQPFAFAKLPMKSASALQPATGIAL